MRMSLWPTDDGWPYPDAGPDLVDPGAEADDDLLTLRDTHLFDRLDPLERQVIDCRFGVEGHAVVPMQQLLAETGLPQSTLEAAMGSGLAKLRAQLS